MPANVRIPIHPGNSSARDKNQPLRHAYIQSLADCLHACLLRGDLQRARRAWAILIRCPEVDWRSRWQWGLLFLSSNAEIHASSICNNNGLQAGDQVRQVERWLNTLRISAKPEEKPALLHALILYLIKQGQYRQALDELDTYLISYPYALSATLHTYAGLLSFYLAQPSSSIPRPTSLIASHSCIPSEEDHASSLSSAQSVSLEPMDQADQNLIRQARGWFNKALEIDPNEQVAQDFIHVISHPTEESTKSESSEEVDSIEDEASSYKSEVDGSERFESSDEFESL
ncbi:hypothetical protein L204_105234 [Cryptococcus depauperatus]|nr:hypothetical protein L204_03883 [Cryptococcus depauperatus CBS 7855]